MFPISKPSFNIKVKKKRPTITAIVAMQPDRGIGTKGEMGWHVPEELQHFKKTTLGHALIMGRATWESIPNQTLPGRLSIVLTSRNDLEPRKDVVFVANMVRALEIAEQYSRTVDKDRVFVIGGETIYRSYLTMFDEVLITLFKRPLIKADAFFPKLGGDWVLMDKTWHGTEVEFSVNRFIRK